MARKPQVNYFESKGGYFCTWKGDRHALAYGPDDAPNGPTYLAALERFKEIMALGAAPAAKQHNTARVVLEHYLGSVAASGAARNTYLMRRKYCLAFVNAGHGELRCSQLTPYLVSAWVDARRRGPSPLSKKPARPWGPGTARIAITTLQAGFNWAVRAGLLDSNPIKGMARPGARSRGRECIVAPDDHAAVVKHASRWLRQVVIVLENTGARPGEVTRATARDWRDDLGAFLFHGEATRLEGEASHKTGQKGKHRVVFLTGEALTLARELVAKYPTGPLFRTRHGHAWTAQELAERFIALRKRCGIARLTAYSYRHTFATAWLERGDSIDVLAALLGNSPAVIRSHYSHLCEDLPGLRRKLEAFKEGASAGTPAPRLRVVGE